MVEKAINNGWSLNLISPDSGGDIILAIAMNIELFMTAFQQFVLFWFKKEFWKRDLPKITSKAIVVSEIQTCAKLRTWRRIVMHFRKDFMGRGYSQPNQLWRRLQTKGRTAIGLAKTK